MDEVLAPDIISSVISLPPWLGSRIRICPRIRAELRKLLAGCRTQHTGHPLSLSSTPPGHPCPKGKGRSWPCLVWGPVGATSPHHRAQCPTNTGLFQGLAGHCNRQLEPEGLQASAHLQKSGDPKASLCRHQGCKDPPSFWGQYRGLASAQRNHSELCTTPGTLYMPTASLAPCLPWVQHELQGTLLQGVWRGTCGSAWDYSAGQSAGRSLILSTV